MYDYYEDFYEPSENDIVMSEIGDILKKMVRKEIMDELEKLRKENAELQEFKRNKEKYDRELSAAKYDYERKLNDAECNIKKARIHDLLGDYLTVGYMVSTNNKRKPKCNKCDEDRRIQYTTPRGKVVYEFCECSEYDFFYEVKEVELIRLRISKDCCWSNKEHLHRYYRHARDTYDDKEDYHDYDYVTHIYDGESFEDIKKSYYNMVFLDKRM